MSPLRRPAVPVWYALVAILVSMLAMAGAAVLIADRAARESEQRWCGLITTMDRAYREEPPATDLGRQLARDIAELRREFRC